MPQVEGPVQFLGILEFLQVASFNHRSLVLMLEGPVGSGYLVMDDGHVTHAVLGDRQGVGALFPLLQAGTEGTFQIQPPPKEPPAPSVSLKTDAILMRVAMNLPPRAAAPSCNPAWRIEGTTDLLSLEEVLQIFEANKRPAVLAVDPDGEGASELILAEGGILKAAAPAKQGAEAVYALLALPCASFRISSPPEAPPVTTMLDVASVVMESLRRLDEEKLLSQELSAEENPHAQEMLEALDRGDLDESARLALAKRYMPGGEVAPAFVVARLTVDESETVRQAAMEALHDLPAPVVEAFANDPDCPKPLLFYLVCGYESKSVPTAAIGNPSTPAQALVEFAPRARAEHMPAFRERRDLLARHRSLRQALRQNPNCDFPDLLDELDKAAAPRMRKRAFTGVLPKEKAPEGVDLKLEKPEVDPRKQKPGSKLGPRDLQYLAKRGSLREKMKLVCGNDDDIAVEIVSQPGAPESFIVGVAESKAANAAALRYIAGHRTFRRSASIVRALVFNPKTPVPSATGLLTLIRAEDLNKIATSRDLPDGTRQGARQLAEKRQKKRK